MKYKIAQLVVNPEEANAISQVFISQPGMEEEALLGRLFVIVESRNRKADIEKLINFIAKQIEQNYYQNEKVMLMERLVSIKPEDIFEAAIAKLNQNIISFLKAEKIKLIIKDTSLTIGVLYKNKIHFTNIGRNKALLIYQPKAQEANQDLEYDLADITKKTNDPTQEVFNINKLFNNVVSGTIPAGGCFIFTNEALSEYLSEKQLIKVLTTLHPAGAVEQIKNILAKTNIHVPFLALVIKSTKLKQFESIQKTAPVKLKRNKESELLPANKKIIPKNDQTKTIDTLNNTEKQTASILNPTGLINFKKIKKIFKIKSFKRLKPNSLLLKTNIVGRRDTKFTMENLVKTLVIIKKLATILFNFLFIFVRGIFRKNNWQKIIVKTKNTKKSIQQMKRKHKIILIVILGCVLILIVNLIISNAVKEKRAKQEAYLQLVNNIEQKQATIKANLIYGNRNESRIILNEIKKLLTNFPQENEVQQKKYVELNNKYQAEFDVISNVKRIDNPQELKSFLNESSLNSLAILNNKLYVIDNNSKTIHSIDLKTKQTLSKKYTNLKNVADLGKAYTNKNTIYYYNNSQIVAYTPSKDKLEKLMITLPPQESNVMTIFNNRFYLFDANTNQIYRYSLIGNKLENRRDWLKYKNNFLNVKSISINGYVYILDANTVLKYGGGRRQNFILDIVEPPLVNPSKIIALSDLDLIYILDSEQNRLIVYNQNGEFLTQYTSDKFNNLIDFTIDSKNKKVYVLNGQTIYQIDLYQEKK